MRRPSDRASSPLPLALGWKPFEHVVRISLLMNRTMPAVVNYASEAHSVELREVPVPEIGNNDVLLAVQAVAVCGTDIHVAYEKHTSGKISYPVILGHEFGGVIVQAAKDLRGFKEGDRVVSESPAIIDET